MKSLAIGLAMLVGARVTAALPKCVEESCVTDNCFRFVSALDPAECERFQTTVVAPAAVAVTITRTISRDVHCSSLPSSAIGEGASAIESSAGNTRVPDKRMTMSLKISLPVRQAQAPFVTATPEVPIFPDGSCDDGKAFSSACSCMGVTAAVITSPSRSAVTETYTVYPTNTSGVSNKIRKIRRDGLEDVEDTIDDELVASEGDVIFSIDTLDEEEYLRQATNVATAKAKAKRHGALDEMEGQIDDKFVASEGPVNFSVSTLESEDQAKRSSDAKPGFVRRDGALDEVEDTIDEELVASEGSVSFSVSTLDDEEKSELAVGRRKVRRDGALEEVEDSVDDELVASEGAVTFVISTLEEAE
ncbi:hypothetical protein P154DRAFT_577694 [Amniculicola lignicola CBS 123094]|uniref:Extracellular membrane protein CFEM domain-containing protein n=1 Tax=Amniculicola lignicola CBS 123094 TaxID=1392246 RepID=A0A6A5WAZ1_9PLEO|nr:hypothetical protein P154DRAFT_577694 [Amniculicola lignicola CBS 123094]